MTQAILNEIYASYQGEGAYLGHAQTFIRFQGCSKQCQWCDSPQTFAFKKDCFRIETKPYSTEFESLPNPISPEKLTALLSRFPEKFLSLTGGEPLEQTDFLEEWLPTIKDHYKIMLETAGTHPTQLERIIDHVDIISMDIKIPSSTGTAPHWDNHAAFLKIGSQKDIYIKCAVTEDTHDNDLEKMIALIQKIAPHTPLFLQPTSKTKCFEKSPSVSTLTRHMEIIKKELPQVLLVPQIHNTVGVL